MVESIAVVGVLPDSSKVGPSNPRRSTFAYRNVIEEMVRTPSVHRTPSFRCFRLLSFHRSRLPPFHCFPLSVILGYASSQLRVIHSPPTTREGRLPRAGWVEITRSGHHKSCSSPKVGYHRKSSLDTPPFRCFFVNSVGKRARRQLCTRIRFVSPPHRSAVIMLAVDTSGRTNRGKTNRHLQSIAPDSSAVQPGGTISACSLSVTATVSVGSLSFDSPSLPLTEMIGIVQVYGSV